MGRYYAMDRDNRWDRVEQAYKALTKGRGQYRSRAAVAASRLPTTDGKNDEFVVPAVVTEERQTGGYHPGRRFRDLLQLPSGPCKRDHPCILLMMILTALQERREFRLTYVCFTDYDETIPNKAGGFP